MSKDVKLLAKNFSQKAKVLGLKLSHSQALELLAFTKGFPDWNAYSANLNSPPVINKDLIHGKLDKQYENKSLPKEIKNSLALLDAINQSGGLKSRQVDEIADYLNISRNDVEDYLNEASDFLENQKENELKEFFRKFQNQGYNVFEFIVNEENSLFVVSSNLTEAEKYLRDKLKKDGENIYHLCFNYIQTFDQLYFHQYSDDFLSINHSMLEQLFNSKDEIPFLLARSMP